MTDDERAELIALREEVLTLRERNSDLAKHDFYALKLLGSLYGDTLLGITPQQWWDEMHTAVEAVTTAAMPTNALARDTDPDTGTMEWLRPESVFIDGEELLEIDWSRRVGENNKRRLLCCWVPFWAMTCCVLDTTVEPYESQYMAFEPGYRWLMGEGE